MKEREFPRALLRTLSAAALLQKRFVLTGSAQGSSQRQPPEEHGPVGKENRAVVFAPAAWEDPWGVFPLCTGKGHTTSVSKLSMHTELRRTESQ